MGENGWKWMKKWVKMNKNGRKLRKMKSSFRKWGKMVCSLGNEEKWEKMEENEWKWICIKMLCAVPLADRVQVLFFNVFVKKENSKNGWKWKKMSRNEEKWMKMSKNGWKWTEMVFVHFGSFWPIFDHFASFVKGGMPFHLENGHSLKGQTVCGYSKTSSLFTYY